MDGLGILFATIKDVIAISQIKLRGGDYKKEEIAIVPQLPAQKTMRHIQKNKLNA